MKTEMVSKVIQKFQKREAVIGIVGMGYVGIPLMLCFSEKGYKTVGFDIDDRRVNELNSGKSSIEHITNESISNAVKVGFSATTDFSRIKEVDGIILCVPTPLDKYREPDISYIVNSMESIGPYLKAGQVISLESTTYPGTTDEEIKTRVEARGLKVGENFFVVYSPEREDPGRKDYTTKTTPKVIGGCTPACLEAGICMYQQAIDTLVPVSSTKAAEMTKVLENIHRAVNIGLMNELKIVADKMGMDIHEVIRAAATKPFGFVAYHPGPGIGGHCIPIDPFYLTWKAREFGVHTKFIELAGEINSSMPHYVVDKTAEALNDFSKSLRGSKILLLGLAYKMNVDDIRESPSLEILKILQEKGAHVDYSDPHVNQFPKYPRNDEKIMKSVGLTAQTIASYDAVILATQHARFDYDLIKNHAKLIIDSRGKYSMNEKNVVRA